MNIAVVIPLVIIGIVTLGLTFSDANAELNTNNAFILEGSGFAVTEESIKTSEIDFAISTGTQQGSTIRMLIEDGFETSKIKVYVFESLTAENETCFEGVVSDLVGKEFSDLSVMVFNQSKLESYIGFKD